MLTKKFFLIFLIFISLKVFAMDMWIVKKIQFEGLNHVSRNEALRNIVFGINNKISENDIQNSIRTLFKTGKFEDIKVFYIDEIIIFKVKERPIISKIVILGNNIIKNDVFRKYFLKLGFKKDASFNIFVKNIITNNIKKYYYDLGRYQAHVKMFTKLLSDNKVTIKILIYEGTESVINSIKIIGNKHFSQQKLLSLFSLINQRSWWGSFKKNIYYLERFKKDLNVLTNFYLNHGYYFFNINKQIINFSKNKSKVSIIIDISEGNKYRISRCFINGDISQYYRNIKKITNIRNNEVYKKKKIDFITESIRRFLSEQGYINAHVSVDLDFNFNRRTIVLNININCNHRYFVNKIYFQGNQLTKDIVLRREIQQIEGEWFNLKLIESGKEALEKIKYLSNVTVETKSVPSKNNAVDIIYTIKEQPTGSINFGIGHGENTGFSVNASIKKDNLFGFGNTLQASVIKNNNQKYADIALLYPYFIDNGTNLNVRLFFNDFKYNFNNISILKKNTFGFEGDLGFLFNDHNRINIGFGYTHNSLQNNNNSEKLPKKNIDNFLLKNTSNDQLLKNSTINDFTINYSWTYNTLKHFYFPVSGNQTYISGKNTIPGSDNNFYKFLLDTEQYILLNKNFIFLTHLRLGIGNSFNKEKLPFYENFHIDDTNNLRGFRKNTIGPKKIYVNENIKECVGHIRNNNICESIESIGGNAITIANIELITPIPFIAKEYKNFFRSAFFLDLGSVWDTQKKNNQDIDAIKFSDNIHNLHASVGVSLQWLSPLGPLSFSYAYPIYKHEHDQLESFQFNIGKNW